MKRKIFTLLVSALFGTMAMAQLPEAVVKKAPVAPVIDGVMDGIWMGANVYNIVTPYGSEAPTLGEEGTTTWRALWTDEGIYILLKVNDDTWMPDYLSGKESYNSDKPEIYFDVNAELKDAGGPTPGLANTPGHYQFAPNTPEADISGTPKTDADGVVDAYMVTDPTYIVEYFVPFSKLKNKDGAVVDVTAPIGFDVTIIDLDETTGTRQRANWSNNGSINESWANMDGCGTITLSEEEAEGGAIIMKAETEPKIDGDIDAVWDMAPANNIEKNFQLEIPTVGDAGETTWKALWNEKGMYILVQVTDDIWFPNWADGGANDYDYDKLELYFDCNSVLKDALGAKNANDGHWQVSPGTTASTPLDGTMQTAAIAGIDYNWATKVADPTYVAEYFVPWDLLVDKDKAIFDKTGTMGFDVTVIDRDPGDAARKRSVWANTGIAGAATESWANMDECGKIMFDGAVEIIYVDKVTLSGGNAITTDNGTLQMVASVEPADASAQKVKWVVENGSGKATISADGLLTGVLDGTVLVKAVAKDAYAAEAKVTVTISGQKVTIDEVNVLKNGNFELGADGKESWYGHLTDPVEDGWLSTICSIPATDPQIWSTMCGQSNLKIADAVTPYILKFKAYASADMTAPLLFEDRGNGNAKALTSTSPYWDGGAYGKFDIPVTTEAQWYTIDVTFSNWLENSNYELNFQVGLNEGTLYIDSFLLATDADLKLVTTARSLANAKSKVQLYPNPVQNELTISKIATANSKVSVYNAVGQKLIEKTANGTQAKFDVSSLKKGMYFVRFSDGSSEKFLKQ